MAAPPAYYGITYVTPTHNDIYPSIDPTSTSLTQPEKVVLITGGGKGIGRSIALAYAKANVACIILLSRTASNLESVTAEINALNPNIRVRNFAVDATSEDEIQKVKEEVIKQEGRLDILINNAGNSPPWVPIPESSASEYWRTFEVNVKSPFLLLHAFLPLLKETGEKTGKGTDVINVSSIGAHVQLPGASAYQISKYAVLRLSEFVDLEFGANGDVKGVRCFSIHPGGVKTDMTANLEVIQHTLNDTPELAGGFCVWLTKGAREWLRGRYLSVQWDVDELEKKRGEIEGTDQLKMRMVV